MSGFDFAASLVGSLAWPIVIVIVAVLFRRQLSALLARPLSSLTAGPLKAVWDRQVAEVEAEYRTRRQAQPRVAAPLTLIACVRSLVSLLLRLC